MTEQRYDIPNPHKGRVFLVTAGEYEYYRVLACFTSPRAAGDFIKAHNAVASDRDQANDVVEQYDLHEGVEST